MIEQILQLPPISQSVIGSAIFAITLWLLKIIYKFTLNKFAHVNKQFNKNRINSELAYCMGMNSGEVGVQSLTLTGLIYIAFNHVLKAGVCLCVGFLLSSVIPIFQEVSVMFSLYFLLKALGAVNNSNRNNSYKDRITELEAELKEIEN